MLQDHCLPHQPLLVLLLVSGQRIIFYYQAATLSYSKSRKARMGQECDMEMCHVQDSECRLSPQERVL